MKKYETPKSELVILNVNDIITGSIELDENELPII